MTDEGHPARTLEDDTEAGTRRDRSGRSSSHRGPLPRGAAGLPSEDAHKIAMLLRGGMLPQAYVYPAEMRATAS